MKYILKKVFLNKINYIIVFACIVVLGIIDHKDLFKMSFVLSCIQIIIVCFIGAFVGELIGKYINKKNKE